jgi:glycosyltransferase involved in cell wall biosynthesis
MDRRRVGIVIPALNESATIANVVEGAQRWGTCIVVDDGSSDRTAELATAAGALVVSHAINLGYDAALNSGFHKACEAGCDVIVTVDADGQHDPDLLQRFIAKIEQGAALVLGVRSRKQRLAETVFSWYTRARYGIEDPLCGMKAYRADLYQALGHFDAYGSIGTELMLFAAQRRMPTATVPFVVRDRIGQPRFGRVLLGNWRIMRALALSIWRSRQ